MSKVDNYGLIILTTWSSEHASIDSYCIPISFMMANKSRYVRGKIFDSGNKNSAINLQQLKKTS